MSMLIFKRMAVYEKANGEGFKAKAYTNAIDQLKSKYLNDIDQSKKEKYNLNLKTIIKQIKQIENLVNEFSDFARMPKPLIKSNDLIEIINFNIELLKKFDDSITINFNSMNKKTTLWFLWFILIILWNYVYPEATPLADVLAAFLLSIIFIFLEKLK